MNEIRYPTEKWLTNYQTAYKTDRATAEMAWWDNEIDHDRPTPFDLTDEQAKVAKAMAPKARAVDAYGKATKRERKANPDKREIIATVAQNLTRVCDPDPAEDAGVVEVTVTNAERQIDFEFKGVRYSLTLTAHRPPKG